MLTLNSVLHFTHEEIKENSFYLLHIHMELNENVTFLTTVFTKPTEKGCYVKFKSNIPL